MNKLATNGKQHPYLVFVPSVFNMLRFIDNQGDNGFRYSQMESAETGLGLDADTVRDKIKFFRKLGIVKQVPATAKQLKEYHPKVKWFQYNNIPGNRAFIERMLELDSMLPEFDRNYIVDLIYYVQNNPATSMLAVCHALGYSDGPKQWKRALHLPTVALMQIKEIDTKSKSIIVTDAGRSVLETLEYIRQFVIERLEEHVPEFNNPVLHTETFSKTMAVGRPVISAT